MEDSVEDGFPEEYQDDNEENYMIMEHGLSIITVNKTELLTALQSNLTKHEAEFSEATIAFRESATKRLAKMLEDAKAGKDIQLSVGIAPPPDNRKSYQKVIKMLMMCIKDEIQISDQEFSQYVMDEWNWKAQFRATTSQYMG